jgi:hypothetical protein
MLGFSLRVEIRENLNKNKHHPSASIQKMREAVFSSSYKIPPFIGKEPLFFAFVFFVSFCFILFPQGLKVPFLPSNRVRNGRILFIASRFVQRGRTKNLPSSNKQQQRRLLDI